jgi:hypothetical protein
VRVVDGEIVLAAEAYGRLFEDELLGYDRDAE